MSDLYMQWISAKSQEEFWIKRRRELEDSMIENLKLHDAGEGTSNFEDGGYTIKVTQRMNRKVDADRLQELAAEAGLSEHLGRLFRWKPELNMSAWKAAAPDVTAPLLEAITTTPGRPSFSITTQTTTTKEK